MDRTIVGLLIAGALALGMAGTVAAQPPTAYPPASRPVPPYHHHWRHHWRRVCYWRHHYRHCYMRRW